MKKIAIVFSDIHITKNNGEYVFDLIRQVESFAQEHTIKNIIIAGDIFKERVGQSLSSLLIFQKILEYLRNYNVFIIPGNHDKQDLNAEESYLDIYSEHQNLVLIKNLSKISIGKVNVYFLPFFKDYPDLNLLTEIDENQVNILVSHLSVNGARNNDGSLVEEAVSPKKFNRFDNVFLGHYHNRQQVAKNIHYIGSLYPQNFGEDNEKGFAVVYEDGSFEFKSVEFKKYIKKIFDLSTVKLEKVYRLKEKYTDSKNFIRFVFKGSDVELDKIDISQFVSAGIDVKKEDVKITKSVEAAENNEFIEFNKSEIVKSFVEFCNNNKIEKNQRTIGLQYLKTI